jgi:hypothetical protein
MELAQKGNRQAFYALSLEIAPLITRSPRRRFHHNTEIEDICQEMGWRQQLWENIR